MNIIERVRALYERVEERGAWVPGLAIRVALGVTFISTGWGKLHNLEGFTAFFESLGIPAAGVQAPMVATIELVGGVMVLVGLGTRVAAVLLAGVMAVAIYTAVWPGAAGLVALMGTVEVIYLASFIHLAVFGAGAVSVDSIVKKQGAMA